MLVWFCFCINSICRRNVFSSPKYCFWRPLAPGRTAMQDSDGRGLAAEMYVLCVRFTSYKSVCVRKKAVTGVFHWQSGSPLHTTPFAAADRERPAVAVCVLVRPGARVFVLEMFVL